MGAFTFSLGHGCHRSAIYNSNRAESFRNSVISIQPASQLLDPVESQTSKIGNCADFHSFGQHILGNLLDSFFYGLAEALALLFVPN